MCKKGVPAHSLFGVEGSVRINEVGKGRLKNCNAAQAVGEKIAASGPHLSLQGLSAMLWVTRVPWTLGAFCSPRTKPPRDLHSSWAGLG